LDLACGLGANALRLAELGLKTEAWDLSPVAVERLNAEAADIARHFPYGGKIKRIYVTAEQLTALNAGELGVVQLNGRYLLVTAEVLAQSEAVFAASAISGDTLASPAADTSIMSKKSIMSTKAWGWMPRWFPVR